ncbi:MAG: hypothetical protein FWG91_05955 [Lachnospiraceae bacterium]|nr:hypothetical protein [Lachnospiraceae bacterium]
MITQEEKQLRIERLRKNIDALMIIISHLEQEERQRLCLFLMITMNCSITYGVENAYTFTDTYERHDIGDRNSVDISEALAELKKLNQPPQTVSSVHSHPDSILPSNDDMEIFFKEIIKNMAVCGNIGKLYYMHKGSDFHPLTSGIKLFDIVNPLITQIIAACNGEDIRHIPIEVLYEIAHEKSEKIFLDICKLIKNYDKGFLFYSERSLSESI